MPYYHGSFEPLDLGLRLRAGDDTGSTDPALDALFESCRPAGMIPRSEAVYMVKDIEDIDAAGGYVDNVYEVEPEGVVEASDLAWYSKAQVHLEEGDMAAARHCAVAYWDGLLCDDEDTSLIEYRARAAVVVRNVDEDVPALG